MVNKQIVNNLFTNSLLYATMITARKGGNTMTDKGRTKFGNFIREKRLDNNLSILELSKRANLSRVTISLIENGHKTGGRKAIDKLATALGMNYIELRQVMKRVDIE